MKYSKFTTQCESLITYINSTTGRLSDSGLGRVLVCFLWCMALFPATLVAQSPALAEKKLDRAIALSKAYKGDSAEALFKELTTKEAHAKYPQIYVRAALNLGRIYGDRGENVTALRHYQDALREAENIGDKASVPHILKNIGVLYVQWKKFNEAFRYYEQAESLAKETDDDELAADCQNNKGIVYEQQQDYNKALAAYKSALSRYTEKNMPEKIAMALSNIAIVYKSQKKYGDAIQYNLKAIAIEEQLNDKWSIAATYNNIGNLYGEMKDYKKAVEYCNKSLSIASEIEAEEIIGMAYESLGDAAANAGDFKNAFLYHKQFSESMNKFINKENARQLSELNIKYETEKKEREFAESELRSRQKNTWLIVLAGLVLISVMVLRSYHNKSKHNQQQLALENALLKEQTNSRMQEQRLEISRDLHDSLGAQLTFVNGILDGLKRSSSDLDLATNNKINLLSDFSGNAIAELKNTLWALNSKEISLEDLRGKMLNFINNAAEAKEDIRFHFSFDVVENPTLNSKLAVNLFRAVQEVINNALKHAGATDISISAKHTAGHLGIVITDNGNGFEPGRQQSRSFGLTNIESRIAEINGKLNLKTSPGKGTTYIIEIIL